MKTSFYKKQFGGLLLGLFGVALAVNAQGYRGGGGGFGGGGFGGGGFGGGGFRGGGGFGGGSSTTSSYNNNGQVGTATFAVDPDTHTIIVNADEETARQISAVIANLDRPQRQVLIKVVFLQLDHNNDSDIGVEASYTGLSKNFSQITGYLTNYSVQNVTTGSGATATTTPTVVPTSVTPIRQSVALQNNFGLASEGSPQGLYQVLGSDFTATLRAIAQAGKAEVLSRPSILARDGQLAEIVAGQYIYLPSGVSFGTVGSSLTTVPTINGSYQNVGIQLDVTPFIGDNNMVEMIVQPQDTAVDTSTPGQVISGGSIVSSAIFAPNINKQSANTVVVTPDAQTVVIGGLISNSKSSSDSKVPILGDIPLLGNLFKSSSKSTVKQELMIFLTPHIVHAPEELIGVSSHETLRGSQFMTNSFSEQELDHFLEKVPVKKNH